MGEHMSIQTRVLRIIYPGKAEYNRTGSGDMNEKSKGKRKENKKPLRHPKSVGRTELD